MQACVSGVLRMEQSASGRLAIGPCRRSAGAPWIPSTDSYVLVVLPPGHRLQVFEAVEGGQWYWSGGVGYSFHDLVQPKSSAE